ncbi:MAG: protein kinase [Candidatus Margulisiibacteriota bacterium]
MSEGVSTTNSVNNRPACRQPATRLKIRHPKPVAIHTIYRRTELILDQPGVVISEEQITRPAAPLPPPVPARIITPPPPPPRQLSVVNAARKQAADILPSARLAEKDGKLYCEIESSSYLCTNRIGSGGTSIVYPAEEVNSKQRVVVKIFDIGAGPLNRRIFEREIAFCRMPVLHSPVLVRPLGTGTLSNGAPFLVYEQMDGDLHSVIEKNKKKGKSSIKVTGECVNGQDNPAVIQSEVSDQIKSRLALLVAKRITYALISLFEKGIAHKDVKPDNIFIRRLGHGRPNWEVKLGDIGLAAKIGPEGLDANEIAGGTPHYLSPLFLSLRDGMPQQEALGILMKNDIYALGITLYNLFTGLDLVYFNNGLEFTAFMEKCINDKEKLARIIHVASNSIPKPWLALILKMVSIDPANTFGTYEELLDAIIKVETIEEELPNFRAELPLVLGFVQQGEFNIARKILNSLPGIIPRHEEFYAEAIKAIEQLDKLPKEANKAKAAAIELFSAYCAKFPAVTFPEIHQFSVCFRAIIETALDPTLSDSKLFHLLTGAVLMNGEFDQLFYCRVHLLTLEALKANGISTERLSRVYARMQNEALFSLVSPSLAEAA